MPRPKTLVRRRCLVACDPCKKRKEKCDGQQPCSNCSKRRRVARCDYSIHGRVTGSEQARMRRDATSEGEATGSTDTVLTLPNTYPFVDAQDPMLSNGSNQTLLPAARVPRLFRMLNDNPGKLSKTPSSCKKLPANIITLSSIRWGFRLSVISRDGQAHCGHLDRVL